jgi:hypothetical protein
LMRVSPVATTHGDLRMTLRGLLIAGVAELAPRNRPSPPLLGD